VLECDKKIKMHTCRHRKGQERKWQTHKKIHTHRHSVNTNKAAQRVWLTQSSQLVIENRIRLDLMRRRLIFRLIFHWNRKVLCLPWRHQTPKKSQSLPSPILFSLILSFGPKQELSAAIRRQ